MTAKPDKTPQGLRSKLKRLRSCVRFWPEETDKTVALQHTYRLSSLPVESSCPARISVLAQRKLTEMEPRMALRLAEYIVRGELFNVKNYSTHGWLQLKGSDRPVMLELTGNCSDDLRGKHFRFQAPNITEADETTEIPLPRVAWHQIGPTGTMTAAICRREAPNSPPVPALYLEWFSQNGRVVIELANPIVEIEGENWIPEPPEEFENESSATLDITVIQRDDEGTKIDHYVIGGEDDDAEDPNSFDLLPDSLQSELDARSRAIDESIQGKSDEDREVIREMELMDHLIEHEPGEPMASIFEPRSLPNAENLSDEQAEVHFKSLIAELALFGIAFHVCEHFTPREAYKLLLEKVLFEERVHPELKGTAWVQNFMTHEYCAKCDEESEIRHREFMAEYEEQQRKKKEQEEE